MAVTLVDADEVRANKLLTDALAANPGVFLQQTTPGQGAAIVRGQRGSSVLHLVDGMRLNNAIFRSAPSQYLALVPATAVERLEILRGTPASLYGSDAVGGAVQVVTRVPTLDGKETGIRGELMAGFDTAENLRLLRGTLDIGNEVVVTSLSGEALETGDRRIGGGKVVSPSAYEARGGRFLMSLTPDDRHSWLFDVQVLEQPSTPRVDELVPGFGQVEPSSSEFYFEPNRRVFAHARYAVRNGPWGLDWRADLSWQRIDDDRRTRNFQANARRLEANRSDLTGLMVTATGDNRRSSWLLGAELYYDRVSSRRVEEDIVSGQTQVLASRFPDGSSLDQAALFTNLDYRVSARNALTGGARISSVDVSLPQTSASPAAAFTITDGSGDLGWRFDVVERWQVLANVGLGFRAPNIFDLGTLGNRPGNRFNIPNTSLDSESVLQADVGVRFDSGQLKLALFAFALRYDDRITSVLTGAVTPDGRDVVQSVNAADSRVRGFELDVNAALTQVLNLRAILNYTWGEQTVGLLTEPGDRLPPLNGRVDVTWDINEAWRLRAAARFANVQDRLSSRDSNDIRIDPNGTPGWGVLGVGADWQPDKNWLVSISADNLLDKRYRNHGSGIDAPGRNLAIRIRRTW
jgi:outer membrane receptor protein involved in Fe transport